jgi:hypothetical protein
VIVVPDCDPIATLQFPDTPVMETYPTDVFPVPVARLIDWNPTEVLYEPLLAVIASFPTTVLESPVVNEHKDERPIATLSFVAVPAKRAESPKAVLPNLPTRVHPKTMPATVGVAATGTVTVFQQTAFAPSEARSWPAVPQEPAQSMIPAPGRMAFVLSPVSQF